MKNPYDEQQTQILARITNNVVKLNDTLLELNQKIEEINEMNMSDTMRAYYYDNSTADQRELHDSGHAVTIEQLHSMRVEYTKLEGTPEENLEQINKLCVERGYQNRDEIAISPTLLENYEAKLKIFFAEHIHEDEEIRFVLEGRGFFDVRDKADRWVRILVEQGDLLVVPAGIYHRFSLDTSNYIRAMRLFKEDPKWTPINRPEADTNKYHVDYQRSVTEFC
ncbi:1,2-dihydroxy-3-keto-5-methylthiopentene dioxygenase [Coemansia sp. RSA 1591]|nr:1,2-dihydroxy-3-keto-5-methylthiopentene dioxygenase [Coemansia sp. RSA 1591]KAJ1744897.1 1,2-dihydroxy-3-keto-5-methylthiopentene dioxygenase [Coemansia sp. RSA 1752]KAJ1755155.1 1,2-dihydroxy-3-keto-5-methylthiopentene dioxygenase [Coemansia sp. RSA 1824]KAJ1772027.1 1,2-dihydroxy-3-keto-5-methylthiopentene dioxygenase [Coemansia sp. RSA 1938]KAJ2152961.1 1,2-dihydroxy-3-keto-5-methylthiopentene dioxygenase [Coemansia sp. RSA 637]KAJ2165518.1 1,2-dihydroxy-3-keto-5-methylthiopentene dioxy